MSYQYLGYIYISLYYINRAKEGCALVWPFNLFSALNKHFYLDVPSVILLCLCLCFPRLRPRGNCGEHFLRAVIFFLLLLKCSFRSGQLPGVPPPSLSWKQDFATSVLNVLSRTVPCCGVCPVLCRMFSLYPLDASSTPSVLTIKNILRHHHLSLGSRISPSWELVSKQCLLVGGVVSRENFCPWVPLPEVLTTQHVQGVHAWCFDLCDAARVPACALAGLRHY